MKNGRRFGTYVTCLTVLTLAALLIFSGCFYKQEHDDPTGPYGTGVQGYRLHVTINPDLLPANGNSTAQIQVRLRDLADGTGVPDTEVYVALYQLTGVYDENGALIGEEMVPWTSKYARLENGMSRIQVRTDGNGVANVTLQTTDSFKDRLTWDYLKGAVVAEVNMELNYTQFQTDASDVFKIYNPYFY